MSSNNSNKVDPGVATIIGALIGAIALIAGTVIGAVIGAKSQPIQVFLGSNTPTMVVQTNIVDVRAPQPTYTVLPTYTPYPTLTPPVTIVAAKPITVIPTTSADQQNPPPGSLIISGKAFEKTGISIYTLPAAESYEGNSIKVQFYLENARSESYILRYSSDAFHLRDDTGKQYPISVSSSDYSRKTLQENIAAGNKFRITFGFSQGLYFTWTSVHWAILPRIIWTWQRPFRSVYQSAL